MTERERAIALAALFELKVTRIEDDALCAEVDALAVRLGGDPAVLFCGSVLFG